jgi:hypothetical protein
MASFAEAVFTTNFWLSGWAIARYIPRSFQVKPVDGEDYFLESTHQQFKARVQRMSLDQPRQWGTMTVAQMLHHLNLACGSSLGFYQLPDESYLVSRTVFRWVLVDWFSEQPIGLRLPAGFKIPHEEQYDFNFEQQQLLAILDAAWLARTADAWAPHCMFGKMTPKEWGKLMLIHVDYHLKQFAA